MLLTSATRQVRQQWFSVGIFPLRLLFGLTGNRPQSAPACSFPTLTVILKMSNEISILNIIILAANVGIIYWTLIHNKKKDFEDQLFKEKFDTYKELIDLSYDALKALDINSDPFAKIYDIKDKAEWQEYFQKEVAKLYKIGFGLEDNIRKRSIYLPATVVDKFIGVFSTLHGLCY